ncbi:hypothetical protein COOONC_01087, partial [Cooperia oncophora]
ETSKVEYQKPISHDCPCTTASIWLDVFFIIDSSSAMTSSGFDCWDKRWVSRHVWGEVFRTSLATSSLSPGGFTVNKTISVRKNVPRPSRFITYGADAQMHHDLNYWKSTNDLLDTLDLRFHGTRGTNIEAAIRLATAGFDSVHHRPNARKVIVIIASAIE